MTEKAELEQQLAECQEKLEQARARIQELGKAGGQIFEEIAGEFISNKKPVDWAVVNDGLLKLDRASVGADDHAEVERAQAGERGCASERPCVICICGSTRFLGVERKAYLEETLAGNIVLSHSGKRIKDKLTGGALDRLHFRKIDMADELLVLNVGGYIGESTRNEIEYAESTGKLVRYLEDIRKGDDPASE